MGRPRVFARRAQLTELMDEPASYEQLRDCLRDLERVNSMVLAYRPTLNWLERFDRRGAAPLHVVDVGCGGGDMLRRIEAWAERRGLPVLLTGIDLNEHTIRAAREFTNAAIPIEWIAGDVLEWRPDTPIDLAISSIFTHHLTNEQIVRFLAWMEKNAVRGWFINDLSRGRISYYGFKLLARVMRWHRFIVHDGPVSILRSFRPEEWGSYAEQAGLARDSVRIEPAWPGRLCVSRVKG